MDILVDGHWSSETMQNNKVVATMAGTYDQTRTTDTTGRLVFRPITSKTSAEHRAAQVEDDDYTLAIGMGADQGVMTGLTRARSGWSGRTGANRSSHGVGAGFVRRRGSSRRNLPCHAVRPVPSP
jgi:hypothetical protein